MPEVRRLVVRGLRPAAVVMALLAALPASAAGYASRTIAGWTVAASADASGCFLTREFADQGSTTVLLGLDIDGANRLSVLNPDWSIKPKSKVDLDFRLSKGLYSRHPAIGIASNGKRGFVTDFESAFLRHFATSGFLDIRRGEVLVARLSLAGSGAAVAELRRCVAFHRSQAAGGSAGKPGPEAIPRDPFAAEYDDQARKN
jgi:hypothetical protein